MPPQTTTVGQPLAQQQQPAPNGRGRHPIGRVVPVIPLTLNSRNTKLQAHASAKSHISPGYAAHNIVTGAEKEREKSKNDVIRASPSNKEENFDTHALLDNVALSGHTKAIAITDAYFQSSQNVSAIPAGDGLSALPEPPGSSPIELDTENGVSSPGNSATVSAGTPSRNSNNRRSSAFVSSTDHSTPLSAVPSMPPHRTHSHHNHASTSSIVFGSHDSLNSSPAPQAPSSFALPLATMGIDSVQQSRHPLPSHTHHTSEMYLQRPVPQAIAPPVPSWKERQMYSIPHSHSPIVHTQLHQAFRYPPREVFTPIEFQQQDGVRSRSTSRTSATAIKSDAEDLKSPALTARRGESTKLWPQEPNPAYPATLPMRTDNFQLPPPPLQLSPQADMWNMQALRSHVEQYFSNQTYSDCVLYIKEGFIGGVHHRFVGHKILLSRSQMLFELIRTSDASNSSSSVTQLQIRLDETYVRIRPFLDSLKFIYGGPLPQANPLRHVGFDLESMAVNRSRMEDALTYIATGSWLKMPVIATRGVEVATCLLNWDTVTIALSFALAGGLSQMWSQYDDVSEDKSLSSSREVSLAQVIRPPKYEPYSTTFLQRIVHSIVQMLPLNFYLDASAPQLEAVPRLPALPLTHTSRPSRSDPRLNKIRFGDVPEEDLQRPSFITTTSSSILLSLPFPILKFLLEHPDLAARLGSETVASIMRQVVAERELRRTKVMNARALNNNGDTDFQLMQNLYCVEVVEPSIYHRAGFCLARKRKDLDTPFASGTETIRS